MPAPAPPQKRKRGWLIWAIPALVIIVAAGVFVGLRVFAADSFPGATPPPAPLAVAWKQCTEPGELADGDKTLVLDMEGKKAGSGTGTIGDLTCVLGHLHAPAYVTAEMEKTRALDGRQTQSWDVFEASWTYHPDDGLDVIIRQMK
jgi:hypothetical protein